MVSYSFVWFVSGNVCSSSAIASAPWANCVSLQGSLLPRALDLSLYRTSVLCWFSPYGFLTHVVRQISTMPPPPRTGGGTQGHPTTKLCPQPFSYFILRQGLSELPRMILQVWSSCLSLLSSWNYRHVSPFPVHYLIFAIKVLWKHRHAHLFV